MTLDHRQHHLEKVRAGLSVVVYPLQAIVNFPFIAVEWLDEGLSTRQSLLKENEQLRKQSLELKARLQKFNSLENENMRLRELLESSFKAGDRVLIAELLKVNLEPYTRKIVINKGDIHEVYVGQPLVDAYGIMGQVTHVGPFTSSAMLITDPNHAIPVQVIRNGLRAIASGTGSVNQLELINIPNNTDIKKGDRLVTSGLGGRFPSGYPVATVISVEKDPGLRFARVIAEPTAHLQRTREVLLVWPAGRRQETIPTAKPAGDKG